MWTRRSGLRLVALCAVAIAASGCATSQRNTHRALYTRSHPEMTERVKVVRTTGILPPDIKVYSVSAGGVEEVRDDWSRQGREHVLDAVRRNTGGRVAEIKPAPGDRELEELIGDVQALYRAVSASIVSHTLGWGPDVFRHKVERFEYSIGPIDALLRRQRADALLIVQGYDEVSTGGRKALRTVGAIIPFAPKTASDSAGMSMALVDRTGAVLWFNVDGGGGGIDFRDRESTAQLVEALMTDFPRAGR